MMYVSIYSSVARIMRSTLVGIRAVIAFQLFFGPLSAIALHSTGGAVAGAFASPRAVLFLSLACTWSIGRPAEIGPIAFLTSFHGAVLVCPGVVVGGFLFHDIIVPLNVLHGVLCRRQLQVADRHRLTVNRIRYRQLATYIRTVKEEYRTLTL